jgi:hypothetical protein
MWYDPHFEDKTGLWVVLAKMEWQAGSMLVTSERVRTCIRIAQV